MLQKVSRLLVDQFQLAHHPVLFLANTPDRLFHSALLHFARQQMNTETRHRHVLPIQVEMCCPHFLLTCDKHQVESHHLQATALRLELHLKPWRSTKLVQVHLLAKFKWCVKTGAISRVACNSGLSNLEQNRILSLIHISEPTRPY